MRRDPARRLLRREDDLLVLRVEEVLAVELALRQGVPVALGEQLEDQVPALDDHRCPGDDERRLARAVALRVDLHGALDDGVPHEVVVRRRLRQRREDRGLGDRQLGELLPEVALRRGLDPVGLVAVVVLVEVGGDDVLLALDALVRLGEPDRLDDLLELPLDLAVGVLDEVRVEEPLADELLGDRRGAAAAAAEAVDAGRDDRQRVEAGVLPERLVLDRGLGVDDDRRDLLERHDLAPGLADLASSISPVRS